MAPLSGCAKGTPVEVVLAGAGHAHVEVVRRWGVRPAPGARLTLVTESGGAVYSGMVPGLVAGRYAAHEITIDARALAKRSGTHFVEGRVVAIDAHARRLSVEGHEPIAYDVLSLDVGAGVAGLDVPGVREHALPTRPIGAFVGRLDATLEKGGGAAGRVCVVGGGAAGVELAFTVAARLGREAAVTLLDAGERLLADTPEHVGARVRISAERRGIAVRLGVRVAAVQDRGIVLDTDERLDADRVLWASGAAAHAWLRTTGLLCDVRGFVRTRATLQTVGHDDVFAVGDCAVMDAHPDLPRAGVHPVRQGPVLADNLRALVAGARLRPYRPQRDVLRLLNLGDGTALATKWGLLLEGRPLMWLKDRIDRRFVARYQRPYGRALRDQS